MVTIGMNYRVLPGKEHHFEGVCLAVIRSMEGTPGHLRSSVFRDVADGQRYLILSEWGDKAGFEAFIRSPTFRHVVDWGRDRVLAEPPRHDYFERGPATATRP